MNILEIFEALGGLGRFGRMLRAFLHGSGWSGRALERLLDGFWRGLGGLGEVLGVMLGPKMAAKSGSYRKKCCLKRKKVPQFFDGCCVEDKQPSSPQNLYLRFGILISNQIGVFNTDTIFCSCWVPTWPHVGLPNPGKSKSGGSVGVSWAVLGGSRRFFGAARKL